MYLYVGKEVRYRGKLYTIAALGSWGVRIERLPDTVLIVMSFDLERP
jgi:hypothetical protein